MVCFLVPQQSSTKLSFFLLRWFSKYFRSLGLQDQGLLLVAYFRSLQILENVPEQLTTRSLVAMSSCCHVVLLPNGLKWNLIAWVSTDKMPLGQNVLWPNVTAELKVKVCWRSKSDLYEEFVTLSNWLGSTFWHQDELLGRVHLIWFAFLKFPLSG